MDKKMTVWIWELLEATEKMEQTFVSNLWVEGIKFCVDGIIFECIGADGEHVRYKWYRLTNEISRVQYWRDKVKA